MQTITPQQLKCFNTIVSNQKISKDDKETMVLGISGGRATSSKDLFFNEAAALIGHLKKATPIMPDEGHKMRGKILSICHTLGWYKAVNGEWVMVNGKKLLDYDRINAFCLKAGKKRLDKFDLKELQKMIYIFEKVEEDYLSKI